MADPSSSSATAAAGPRKTIGFVLNPIAGMGGRVGLKGTDGPEVLEEALRRGAQAQAHRRAAAALKLLAGHNLWRAEGAAGALWLACGGSMGAEVLETAGFAGQHHRLIYFPSGEPTTAEDTRLAVRTMVSAGAELIVFCGGDGTARDVMEALLEAENSQAMEAGSEGNQGLADEGQGRERSGGQAGAIETAEAELLERLGNPDDQASDGQGASTDSGHGLPPTTPVVGIPAGVKMHSAVFGQSPAAAAELVELWLAGRAGLRPAEVMDVDEEAYREGRLAVKLHGHLRVPYHADLLQGCKCVFGGEDEQEAVEGLAETLAEMAAAAPEETLWLLGPGSTVAAVKMALGLTKPTLLGVDALLPGGEVRRDLEEAGLLQLLDDYPEARLVVSPIGAQGFLFGRGNQQFSPAVLARLGREHILVVASPHKLRETPRLLLDTGQPALDEALSGYHKVTVGYHTSRMTLVESAGKLS